MGSPLIDLSLPMVVCKAIDKKFVLKHTRSIKEYIVWTFRGRKGELRETFKALDGVDLTVHRGESVALLGVNGSGKSTLLKVISGVLQPDEGSCQIRGRVAGLIEVGAGLHPDLTGRENIYLNGAILGMTHEEIDAKFDDIVAFATAGSNVEKFIDTEVKFYSSGMFLRLAFAVSVFSEPDIFLVDEILTVGDEPFQRKCIAKIRELRASGQTLVVVSHDLDLVSSVCERGVVLQRGKLLMDGEIKEAIAYVRELTARDD